ncbi:integrin beta-2-like [Chanos chanos]|uniref:Integrin beta n=1 Tax=Chanos chanos TaxID=29144 RepID=A0A6J2WG71_CHACN|nr:integrin beta-2-like [Chanos chanos]
MHLLHLCAFGVWLLLWMQYSLGQNCAVDSISTCEECISSSADCSWCQYKYLAVPSPSSHCGSRSRLVELGCPEADIIDPESSHTVISQSAGAEERKTLKPRNISLELRPGKAHTFQVQVKSRKSALGVYYLASVSFETEGGAYSSAKLRQAVLTAVQEVNAKAVSTGSGLFGEEQKQGCKESVCGKVLHLTHSSHGPPGAPHSEGTSSHGGLQALLQTALCRDEISKEQDPWLLVYVSDQGFRVEEDQISGLHQTPSNTQCLMSEGKLHKELVYPSIADLGFALTEKNIQTIFAVTEDVAEKYRELSDRLPKSTVAVLPSDPSQITSSIKEAFKKLSHSVVLSHTPVQGLNISYESQCAEGTKTNQLYGACSDVTGNRKISFGVTVTLQACVKPQWFEMKAMGSPDAVHVHLSSRCSCDCNDKPDPEHCNYAGNLTCGTCLCNPGHFGPACECSLSDSDAPCREREGAPVCSGRGVCVCGTCECDRAPGRSSYGRFCECDNFSCERAGGKICGGHGRCECGTCVCDVGFEGSACSCSTEVDQCRSKNGMICNGRGNCICNQCRCERPYMGPQCEECPTCDSPCTKLASCVECLGFGTGLHQSSCRAQCANIRHMMVDTLKTQDTGMRCRMRDTQDCMMDFTVKRQDETDHYAVHVQSKRVC